MNPNRVQIIRAVRHEKRHLSKTLKALGRTDAELIGIVKQLNNLAAWLARESVMVAERVYEIRQECGVLQNV